MDKHELAMMVAQNKAIPGVIAVVALCVIVYAIISIVNGFNENPFGEIMMIVCALIVLVLCIVAICSDRKGW